MPEKGEKKQGALQQENLQGKKSNESPFSKNLMRFKTLQSQDRFTLLNHIEKRQPIAVKEEKERMRIKEARDKKRKSEGFAGELAPSPVIPEPQRAPEPKKRIQDSTRYNPLQKAQQRAIITSEKKRLEEARRKKEAKN